MNTCITESEISRLSSIITEIEISQLFKDRERENFELLQTTKKITFEFHVNIDGRDRFLELVNMLSNVEFMVDVDLDHIHIIGDNIIDNNVLVFRIKASGKKKYLDLWNSNLCSVAEFLNGDNNILYFKDIVRQKN